MTIQAIALFCEDVREEKSGQFTIIGILPDNVNFTPGPPGAHAVLPKLALYVRVHLTPDENPGPISIKITFPNGEEKKIGEFGADLIETAKQQARTNNTPIAGLISSAVMQGFHVGAPGQIMAVLEASEFRHPCGVINFIEMPEEASPSAIA